nr:hypothetical protein CFP56_32369 [Quercus suber]
MRAQNWSLPGHALAINAPTDDFVLFDSQISKYTTPQSFSGLFAKWWCKWSSNPQVDILSPILRALRTATESYIGHRITDAVIVFPARTSSSLYSAVSSATCALALNMPIHLRSSAGQVAAVANRINGQDSDLICDPEQLVLTVDYSRAALTMMLFIEECGLFDDLRGMHNTSLGLDSWSAAHRELLRSELRQIMRVPVDGHDGALDHINSLVLLGEHGNDKELQSVLKQILQETNNPAVVDIMSSVDSGRIDPLFAAAVGAATTSLEHLESVTETGCLIDLSTPDEKSSELSGESSTSAGRAGTGDISYGSMSLAHATQRGDEW